MRKKVILFILLIIIIFIFAGYFFFYKYNGKFNKKTAISQNKNEIEPEIEFPEGNNYDTEVKLFLVEPSSGVLTGENVTLDARIFIDNPYKYLINLLIKPPEDVKLKSAIDKNTKINNCVFEKGILTVDLSGDFLKSSGTNAIYSIVDTVSEFNDIKGVKFLINGEENTQLKGNYVRIE